MAIDADQAAFSIISYLWMVDHVPAGEKSFVTPAAQPFLDKGLILILISGPAPVRIMALTAGQFIAGHDSFHRG